MGRHIVRTLEPWLEAQDPQVEVVAAVPTSRSKLRRRGYNQAQVIAETVAAQLGVALADPLDRPGPSSTQTTLGPSDREDNVRDVFVLRDFKDVTLEGRTLLLVDDVITTGATLASAARALAGAGPARILACVFSRRIPLGDSID